GAIRRSPRFSGPREFSELLFRQSSERLGWKNHSKRLTRLLPLTRCPTRRPFLGRRSRFLSRYDLRRSTRSTLLQLVDIRRVTVSWNDPEFHATVQVRIA